MNATIQADQSLSAVDAIHQAVQERDICRMQYTAIYELALSRVPSAIALLAARNFSCLEKKWRRDPVNYRDSFAAHHLGAAYIAGLWGALAGSLEDDSQSPTLELILECIRAEGSSIDYQKVNETGHFLIHRFLIMQDSPVYAVKKWLKILKCDDPEQFRRGLDKFIEPDCSSCFGRLELLEMAWKKAAEWQKIAELAQKRFDEYSNTLQNSPIPSCQADRTLDACFHEARIVLLHAEKQCQKLLKHYGIKDLLHDSEDLVPDWQSSSQVQQVSKESLLKQSMSFQQKRDEDSPPLSSSQQKPAVVQNPGAKKRHRQNPISTIQAVKTRRKPKGANHQQPMDVTTVKEFLDLIDFRNTTNLTG